jgi:hypothetical protein
VLKKGNSMDEKVCKGVLIVMDMNRFKKNLLSYAFSEHDIDDKIDSSLFQKINHGESKSG